MHTLSIETSLFYENVYIYKYNKNPRIAPWCKFYKLECGEDKKEETSEKFYNQSFNLIFILFSGTHAFKVHTYKLDFLIFFFSLNEWMNEKDELLKWDQNVSYFLLHF